MAAATLTLASIFGATVIANYDDVTLVVSSVTINTTQASRSVFVEIDAGAQTQSLTASPGINGTLTFNPQLTLGNFTLHGHTRLSLGNATLTAEGVTS